MVDIDERVIEEAVHEGESMSQRDLFSLIERQEDDRPGVSRETVTAFARELESRRDYAFDAEGFLDDIDDQLASDDTWEGPDRLYELGADRLSQYPAEWHDRLGGSTDAEAYVRFIVDEVPEFIEDTGHSRAGAGIAEDTLVEVIMSIGGVDRKQARAAIEEARERGELTEDVDQHPQAGVYLAERDIENADGGGS